MPQNLLRLDRDQPMLLSPDLRDWLDDDHLAWYEKSNPPPQGFRFRAKASRHGTGRTLLARLGR